MLVSDLRKCKDGFWDTVPMSHAPLLLKQPLPYSLQETKAMDYYDGEIKPSYL